MKRVLPVVVVLVAGVVGWWWWRGRSSDYAARPVAAGSASVPVRGSASVSPAYQAPGHVAVTVSDAKGVLAKATVRMAGPDGEIAIATTGADGVARADVAAGAWKVGVSAADHEPAAIPARTIAAGETVQLAIKLEAGGRTLSGTVTDATGGPIAGARVDAARLGGLARPSDAVASTTTGADGKYRLTASEGQLLVAVGHADYAAQSRYVDLGPAGATADFALVPGGVIEGVVRDEKTKEPVAGAHVIAARDRPAMLLGDSAQRHVTAGADGHFRITGLRPGSYELDASLGARYARSPTVVGLGVAEQVSDIVIFVAAGRAIRGTVVDDHGVPAPGVEIQTFAGERRGYGADEKSDAKGAFVLDGLPPGHYRLIGASDAYVAHGATDVELGTKDVGGVVVHVRRGGKVKGHVEPRQVCEVRLDVAESALGGPLPILVTPATTGPDGEFELGPASPIPYVIAARCPGGDQGRKPITVAPDMPEVVVEVAAGASIAGRVVDGSGKPVAAAIVMAAPQTGSEQTTIVNGVVTSGAQALTAGNGTFEIKGLAAGSYRLRVLDRGRPIPVKKGDQKYTVSDKQRLTGIELAVDRSDGVIQGTVTGADGKPVADAWVSVEQSLEDMLASMHGGDGEAQSRMITVEHRDEGGEAATIAPVLTDSNGHFVLGSLAHVPWTVVAEAQAGRLRGRAVQVTPDATITIQALAVTELHGTAHVAGAPPESFSVVLDGPTRAERTFAWTDGTFSFGRVDPGTYAVRVTSSAGNVEAQVNVAASTNVDITLAANAIVTGKLVDATGKPVAGIPVAVVPDQGPGRLQIQLDGPPPASQPDGTFRVETEAGKVVVAALAGGRPATKSGVIAEAGKTVDIGNLVVEVKTPP